MYHKKELFTVDQKPDTKQTNTKEYKEAFVRVVGGHAVDVFDASPVVLGVYEKIEDIFERKYSNPTNQNHRDMVWVHPIQYQTGVPGTSRESTAITG